jgi:hypothetical protein
LQQFTHHVAARFVQSLRLWRWRVVFGVAAVAVIAVPLAFLMRQPADALSCSCTIFTTPTGQSNFNDPPLEVGLKFIPNVNGYINGVRYYKQGTMGGTHTGRLWTVGGTPIATATFTGETASGWQEVAFSSPVQVTAGTTYVASVSMWDGRYIASSNSFGSDIVSGPLTVPSSASSGGNGVYNGTAGLFPASSFNAANYWVDVSFFDETAPDVTGVTPTDGATGTLLGESITATFTQNMDSASLPGGFVVHGPGNTPVPGVTSYNNATKTATFIADNGFTPNTTYTATLEGGTGTTAKNAVGVPLASDFSWSFSTTNTNDCPCTLKNRANPAGSNEFDEGTDLELGVKIKATTNGYLTAMRFYKPLFSPDTSTTGNVWNATGTNLATVAFNNMTDYGWQEAKLATPLRLHKGQTYILSYGTSARYQASANGIATTITNGYLNAYFDTSVENAATGSGNRNGVYGTTAGAYPNSGSPNGSYYWVDGVFSVEPAPVYPLQVDVTQPTNGSYGAPRTGPVTAKFNRPLDAATVNNTTFRLFDASNNLVAGTASFNTTTGAASFTPSLPLAYGQRYTARLAATIADPGAVTLGSEYSWSFTTGSAVSINPNYSPGGPILLVTSTANKYSPYYAEILRTEGFNYFSTLDLGSVTAAALNNYDAVILPEMPLSQAQADMLSSWVVAGGNLIAMRPDVKLAGLLGITSSGSTRSNQYLLIDTGTSPGNGLVGESMQFKGTADNYTLSGATAVATLYASSGVSTSNPAATTRTVGSNGGTAAAFSYDLAKSVAALHQGNQSWAGQNRDNDAPVRSNDLFFGALAGDIQPDWIDPAKFHIPQADEQQRLFANMLITATRDRKPLPRFWYLPNDYKAALVMAGDDHSLTNSVGTEPTNSVWIDESPTRCSLADWQCIRSSHYIYQTSALTLARAQQFNDLGFEIGDHISSTCSNFASQSALNTEYTNDLTFWRSKYTTIPNQTTHRYHCYVWSDWDSQAIVEKNHGIRYDLNYVAYPSSWVGSKAPVLTGSAMNMRFADSDGDTIDVRQGVTNLDNTSSPIANINALLDNALGPAGFYGIYGTHYDMIDGYDNVLYGAAKSRNVPMISSVQALTWLDGRDSSSFTNFSGSNGRFTFGISAAEGANGLQAMLPIQDTLGTLASLTINNGTVSYSTRTVKGVQYAVFSAAPGDYVATYTDYDPTQPNNNGGSSGNNNNNGSGSGTGNSSRPSTNTSTPEQTATPETTTPVTPSTTPETGPSDDSLATPPGDTKAAPKKEDKGGWPVWKIISIIVFVGAAGAAVFIIVRKRRLMQF